MYYRMVPWFVALQLATLLSCAAFLQVDRTLEEGATGEDVVIATVNKITESEIFQNDFQFLRRMAFVETNFTELDEGGIWAISADTLRIVSSYILYLLSGQELGVKIEQAFGINWTEEIIIDDFNLVYNHQRMNVPLYSALAVMIRIRLSGDIIQDDIVQQARLWKNIFKPSGSETIFIEKAEMLEAQVRGNETEVTSQPDIDRTLEEGATGEDVVIATVNKITESEIFQNDFQFLRRMAYVETNFTELDEGGIWAISADTLRVVSIYISYIHSGQELGIKIEEAFDINWTEEIVIDQLNHIYNHQRMNVPLYSALAVMIRIRISHTIQDDIVQQARLWKAVFKPSGSETIFIEKAEMLEAQVRGNETEVTSQPDIDQTLEEGATGEDVVIATVNKITESEIFQNDFQFLRRMAFVETNFTELGEGGIWAISADTLRVVSRYILYLHSGQELGVKIEQAFGINWTEEIIIDDFNLVYNQQRMNVPLYSALAVMIRIRITNRIIQDNIVQQAQLWKMLFKSSGNEMIFIEKVEMLEV